ncbi:MAG: HDOD domain-containing protein [Candidatus Cloacimonetes bacterium]|nr:HDOD domain-containing protein [Candidatus Cloacimonadota bacterium]
MPADIEYIRSELEQIKSLPTLPIVASKLLHMMDKPDVSMVEISKLIAVDPALTSRVLKIANSPYYGVRNRIDTIKLALVVLGLSEIRNVMLSVSLFRTFSRSDGDSRFDQEAFWRHSIAVAHFAKKIARDFRIRTHGEEFTAGLLHDIGKIIIAQYFGDTLGQIKSLTEIAGMPVFEAEEKALGLSHMDIGAWLADKWKIPQHLTKTIRFHHFPHLVIDNPLLTNLVCVANLVANYNGLNLDPPPDYDDLVNHDSWKVLCEHSGLSSEIDIEGYIETLEDEKDGVDKYMAISF